MAKYKKITRFVFSVNRALRVLVLRMRGVQVAWTANVHWSAEISMMKGSIVIGPRTTIDKGVILRTYGGKISVGPDCSLNPYVILYGHGGLKIGRGVRIAAQTVIIPANHTYSDPSTYIFEQGETRQGIVIQDNVWLGTGVRVLDGTTIGEGSVVGAGSVVTKNLQKGGVFVGVPARKIASRY